MPIVAFPISPVVYRVYKVQRTSGEAPDRVALDLGEWAEKDAALAAAVAYGSSEEGRGLVLAVDVQA